MIVLTLLLAIARTYAVKAAQMRNMNTDLSLTAAVDRPALVRGETIRIAATVKNISPHRVLLFTQLAAYSTANVKLRTEDGTELRTYINVILSLAPPSLDDILELDPGAEWTASFLAGLRELAFEDVQTQGHPEVRGIFLDFGNSSVRIPSVGRYELSVEINYRDDAMTYLESLLGLSGIWRGFLRSNPVPLDIQ